MDRGNAICGGDYSDAAAVATSVPGTGAKDEAGDEGLDRHEDVTGPSRCSYGTVCWRVFPDGLIFVVTVDFGLVALMNFVF